MQIVWPRGGAVLTAALVMISTFGCANGLILTGARVLYAMARDGVFWRPAGLLNHAQRAQRGADRCRRLGPACSRLSGSYSDLLDYVIFAQLLFYVLTVAAVFRLRVTRPDAAPAVQGVGLSAGAGRVHRRRHRADGRSADRQAAIHLARAVDCTGGYSGVRSPGAPLPQCSTRTILTQKVQFGAPGGVLGPHLHPHPEGDFAGANSLSDLSRLAAADQVRSRSSATRRDTVALLVGRGCCGDGYARSLTVAAGLFGWGAFI